MKAIVIKDDYNQSVVDRLARLTMVPGGSGHQWIVAVKRTKGESVYAGT